MNYHAHIYWENDEEKIKALSLREPLIKLTCDLGRVWDRPIGPHPLPMFQAKYSDSIKQNVEDLLSNSGLIVLLHEDTGDDIKDHTLGARWIRRSLDLNIDWLRKHALKSLK
jgi:DOPA 4,5-dioxygenase